MPQKSNVLPAFEHFELTQLAEGVYAALGTASGAAYSNAGIVDLGNHTLVFDTFNTPQAAQDLRQAAEQLTSRVVNYVVNSHAHADHWCGNQVFDPHTPIIATQETRNIMPGMAAWLREIKKDPVKLDHEIETEQERLNVETDPRRQASLASSISRMRLVQATLPELEFRLPNWTFDGKLRFYGDTRTAELLTQGPGHTSSDAYLVLPDDGIMFMGDLGFFQCQPFMVYCDPPAWTAQLEWMEHSDIATFVPGHGPVGAKADLALQREYMHVLERLVAGVIKTGGSQEAALQTVSTSLPTPFGGWLMGGMARMEANVMSAFQRLSTGQTG